MRHFIEEIIQDFYAKEPIALTRRLITIPELPEGINKCISFIGMRRSGKTFLMHQIIQDLMKSGVNKSQIIYINHEDDRLFEMSLAHLRLIIDIHNEMFPENIHLKKYVFLDEIQEVTQWEKFVRRMLDNENMQIYLTGSSSKMLNKEIGTALRGRNFCLEVYPFSFKEYLMHLNIDIPKHFSSKTIPLLKNKFNEYLSVGGFPEVVQMNREFRFNTLQEYVMVAMYRDIVERHKIKNSEALKVLIMMMLENSACLFSINKAYNIFKSQGRAVSKDKLYEYITYIQDIFLLFQVELHSYSKNQRNANPKKIYAVDTGLITTYSWRHKINQGALFENAVFGELIRRFKQINYYKTKSGKEVDFICTSIDQKIFLYQVSAEIDHPKTFARETEALIEAMKELKIKQSCLITLHHKERVIKKEGLIEIKPAYEWFLLDSCDK